MKRSVCIFFFIYIVSFASVAQTQQGIVKTRGRLSVDGTLIPGTRLSGVTIDVRNRSSSVSGNNGMFSFSVPSKAFVLKDVRKQGYQLCDQDMLNRNFNFSSDPLIIAMETPDNILSDRLAAERKIRRMLQIQLVEKEDEIEALKERHEITENEYHELLQKLYETESDNEKLISEMAERYSSIDFDAMDDFQRKVAFYIQNGQLTRADSMLSTKGSMMERSAELDRMDEAIKDDYEDLVRRHRAHDRSIKLKEKALEDFASDCYSRYEICKMRHQNDSAAFWLELRAAKDTLNTDWQIDCGVFILNYLADYDKAQTYMQNVLRLAMNNTESSDGSRGACLANLADVYLKSDRYDEAIRLYTDSRNLLSEIPEAYIASTIALANCYECIDKHIEALNFSREAYDLYNKNNCSYPKLLVRIYHQLGIALCQNGEYGNGLDFLNLALDIAESEPVLLTVYHDMAVMLGRMNSYDKAEELYKKAIEICLQIYDEDHPMYSSLFNSLGTLYYMQSRFQDSIECFVKAKKSGHNKTHGNSYARICSNLADVSLAQGDVQQAEQYAMEAYEIMFRLYGEDSPVMIDTYGALGSISFEKGDYDKSMEFFEKSISLAESVAGDKHPSMLPNYSFMGGINMRLGRTEEALKCFFLSLEIAQDYYGENNTRTADELANVAGVYLSMGKLEDALAMLERSRSIHTSIHGEIHADVAGDYNGIAQTYMAMGNYEAAISNFQKAIQIRKDVFGANSVKLKSLYSFMKSIYQKMGDVVNEERYDALLNEIQE